MTRSVFVFLATLALVVRMMGQTEAASVIRTLGDQDFADGATVTSGALLAASAGEPFPFNGPFIGSDAGGPNFSASWTFTYGLLPFAIQTASITLGITDHDSAAAGSQLASFTVDGNNLTSLLDALFEASQAPSGRYHVYTVAIPASAFPALADGSATFSLTLQGPGLGILGPTQFNGAGLDFSTIILTPILTPEPAGSILLLAGLAGLIGYVRWRWRR